MANEPQKSPDGKIGEEVLEPIIKGRASVKPKSEGRKLFETFFKGNLETVRRGVWFDVVVPTVMDMLWSTLERAGRGLIYGDGDRYTGRDRERGSVPATRVDFTAYSKRRDRDRGYSERDSRYDTQDVYDYGEVRFEFDRGANGYTREDARRDAERVLARMQDIVEENRWISVAQLFNLIKLPTKYTDRDWGWEDLRGSSVVMGHYCYILRLPKPRPYR